MQAACRGTLAEIIHFKIRSDLYYLANSKITKEGAMSLCLAVWRSSLKEMRLSISGNILELNLVKQMLVCQFPGCKVDINPQLSYPFKAYLRRADHEAAKSSQFPSVAHENGVNEPLIPLPHNENSEQTVFDSEVRISMEEANT